MSGNVLAVREERARIGNVEVCKKTALVATDEGLVAVQIQTIEQQPQIRVALPAPTPTPAIQYRQTPEEHAWYNPQGKGCFTIILLLLFYLVIGIICLPFLMIFSPCFCIYHFCCRDDDDT